MGWYPGKYTDRLRARLSGSEYPLVTVYHDTETTDLALILKNGLKKRPSDCNDLNKWMDEEAIRQNLPVQRCNSIFAYVFGWSRLLKKREAPLPEFRYKQKATISFDVDPTKVFVADMEVATEASQWFTVDLKRAEMFRTRYWDELKTLKKAIPNEFNEMEILIPFDIPPEDIRIIKKRAYLSEQVVSSFVPPTARAIREGGINWDWYQIEDGEDAVTFRLHREDHAAEIEKLEKDFRGRIKDGETNPVRWETFPEWGLDGKFAWMFERYGLCDDCVTAAVVTGKPMREPRKLTKEEEKEREIRSKHLIEKIHKEHVEEILKGRHWVLLNSGIPMEQVTDEQKKIIDELIMKEFGRMPRHLEWRKIELK